MHYFCLINLPTTNGEMELKFSVFASFFMLSLIFTLVNGDKFSVRPITDIVQKIVDYYQVKKIYNFRNIFWG